jgi:hypothetical protein
MIIDLHLMEILYLTLAFTALAIYFDIHNQKHILSFIFSHIIALFIAVILSKLVSSLLIL